MFLKMLGLLLVFTTPCQAAWQGKMETGKIKECVANPSSVEDLWKTVNQITGEQCPMKTDGSWPIFGYVFRCSQDRLFFVFESKEQCERTKNIVNEDKHPPVAEFAPSGTKNAQAWIDSFAGCIRGAVKESAPPNADYLQKISSLCKCTADNASDLGPEKNAQEALQRLEKCGVKPTPEQKKLIEAAFAPAMK